jgi:hypothetical protein
LCGSKARLNLAGGQITDDWASLPLPKNRCKDERA